MRSTVRLLVLTCAVAALAGGIDAAAAPATATAGTRPADADLSTPRAAAAAFVRAVTAGDADAALAASAGDDAHRAWVRAYVGRARAAGALADAVARRFGRDYAKADAGRELREQLVALRSDDLLADLGSAKPGQPRADGVPLEVDDGAPVDRQPRAVQAGGRWRLDLASLSEYMDPADAPSMSAEARAAAKLAADVAAGRFADLATAADAIDEALTAAATAADAGGRGAASKP